MSNQKIIKVKTLKEVHSNMHYQGCAFYLDQKKWYYIENSIFDNCTFRNFTKFAKLDNCIFKECSATEEFCFSPSPSRKELGEIEWPKLEGINNIVTSLSIAKCELRKFPKEVFLFRSLTRLHLEANYLEELPEQISELKFLEVIVSSSNYLIYIPEQIGSLISLRILDLSQNQLTELPKEVQKLNSLKELHLKNNLLNELHKKEILSWLPNCKIFF